MNLTRAEFLALASKPRYERGDRVVTWDRPSRPVLEGWVYCEYEYPGPFPAVVVSVGRGGGSGCAEVPRSRVRLAPELAEKEG